MTHKELAIWALQTYRGDDLERWQLQFRGLSAKQMDQEYGETEQTPREILAELEEEAAACQAAIEWVERAQHT